MTAGMRDRFITFEVRETTTDPTYGTTVEGGWVKTSDAWAEVQDVLPSRAEGLTDDISITRRPARVRIDQMDGVGLTSAMRIRIAADDLWPERVLRIISGPAFVQKTREFEFVAEELSSEGQEP
ncbi:MAG: head-tail adaptor protein [Novosphingobium sp.]|nr:head-tail adaptor protein [Novosphingobium sp.]